jgi:ABC-type branched-subunit amino acid transport system substrate-binding protein
MSRRRWALVLVAVVLLSAVSVQRHRHVIDAGARAEATAGTAPDDGSAPGGAPGDGAQTANGTPAAPSGRGGAGSARAHGASGADCAKGQNGGATDTGVTANEIRLAAGIVKSGIAKSFLSDAQYGIEAVRQKVNRAGGICGRLLTIDYNDDGWDPQRGRDIISKYILSKRYFALAVNPSSEGLRGAIDSGDITAAQLPVVGSDGQLIDQYLTGGTKPVAQPWVWPVATSTASVMHIMARNAYERGARTFGIVWDVKYRFGVEGHSAFVGEVKRLGGTVTADRGVQGGQQSYASEVNDFIGSCGGANSLSRCDFLAVLLEPATAVRWVGDGGLGSGNVRPKIGIGAPQPLFVDSFARDCGKYCANLEVWTSFKPPIPPFDTEPAVATYRSDLAAVSTNADANNPHVEGAYVGMTLLVRALEQLGPNPTRAGLKRLLDGTTLDSGLAPTITFSPSSHAANVGAQAFQAIVNNGSFAAWRYANTGFVLDRDADKDVTP